MKLDIKADVHVTFGHFAVDVRMPHHAQILDALSGLSTQLSKEGDVIMATALEQAQAILDKVTEAQGTSASIKVLVEQNQAGIDALQQAVMDALAGVTLPQEVADKLAQAFQVASDTNTELGASKDGLAAAVLDAGTPPTPPTT